MDETGTIWMLIITILVIYLLVGKQQRLLAAWQGLTGQAVAKG